MKRANRSSKRPLKREIALSPIIMTSMAFIFGMFPLVIATGAGAASRQSIGTGVLGGMLAATFFAIFRSVVLRVDQEADGPDPGAVAPVHNLAASGRRSLTCAHIDH